MYDLCTKVKGKKDKRQLNIINHFKNKQKDEEISFCAAMRSNRSLDWL